MKDDGSKSLVQQPFGYPLAPFSMLWLARALRQVVEGCGEAGDAALEARCKDQDKLDCIKSGEAFTHEEAGRARCKKSCGGAGVNQYDNYPKGE